AKLAGSSSALQLVSRDGDGTEPWLDPRVPIDEDRVTFAAKRLGAEPEEIKRLYEVLSKDLQFKLNLSWASADTRD
ncbi:MAG: hypothetical protein LC647_16460, partial [Beggiatoa sp.]|nr:hypothetical protein [Beggiatoa sp.]